MRRTFHLAAAGVLAILLTACQAPVRTAPAIPEQAPEPIAATPRPHSDSAAAHKHQPEAAAGPLDDEQSHRDSTTSGEVYGRLRASLVTDRCPATQEVSQWRRIYARNPARFGAHLEASLPVLAYVVEELERRDLPGEFALIPMVESSYRTDAMGPGGAAGLWQIMPATARSRGMLISQGFDGRLSVLRATEVALDLLASAHDRFGDWRLAAMAYNAGEFGLARALSRNAPRSSTGGRLQVNGISSHTHAYVARLSALACLLKEPAEHSIQLRDDVAVPRLTVMDVPPNLHRLDSIAKALALDPATLASLNAGHRSRLIVPGAPRRLLVPSASRPHWPSLSTLTDPAPTPAAEKALDYVVRSGDSLWSIAKRHGIRLKDLMSWNRLGEGSMLKPGQVLQLSP